MSERPQILVVDDDPEFLAHVRDGLVNAVPVIANTPLEAMWLLEHRDFRAVLCDLVFGSVDGRHLLELVRQRWPAVARILVTGFGARLGGSSSADLFPSTQAVVLKPCDVAALDELIADLPEVETACAQVVESAR